MSKAVKTGFILVFAALMAATACLFILKPTESAFAGSERIQIFRDSFAEEEIDDFKWAFSKSTGSVIAHGGISNEGAVVMKDSTSWNVIRLKDTVALGAGESVEINFTVDNAKGLFVMPSFNAAADYEDTSVANPFGGLRFFVQTGLSVNNAFWKYKPSVIAPHQYREPYVLKGEDNNGDGYDAYIGQNSAYDENADINAIWGAADSHIGEDGWKYETPVQFRAVYNADGSIYYYMKQVTDAEWATLCIVKSGVKVLAHGYDEVGYIQANAGKPTVSTDATYDEANGDWTTTGGPVMQGVDSVVAISVANILDHHNVAISDISVNRISGGSVKNEISSDNGDWEQYNSDDRVFFDFVQPALIIDNAEDDDYLVKNTALSLPENDLNPYFYDISLDVYAENLTGSAEGVIYLGAKDKNLTDAAELYIKAVGTKTVMTVRDGGADVPDTETELPIDTVSKAFASLKIRHLKTGTNEIYVGKDKVAEFNKDLKQTYLAFGVKKKGGTVKFAVKNVLVYKYNYLQGTGGDFTEDFNDGLYNADNLLIQVHPDYADPTTVYMEDGKLVLNGAYGVTINTMQQYSDFEFSFKLSYVDPSDKNSVFGVAFGKPIAEAGECLVWLQFQKYGGFVIPEYPNDYIDYDRDAGYHEWSSPAREEDGDGNILWTCNVYTHDYEDSALTVKFVKQDTVMSVYAYFDEESDAATTPFIVYKDCYGFGCADIRTLATGVPLTLTIDEITLKNLDENKGKIAKTNPNNRQELVLEKVVIIDTEGIEDPVNPIVEYDGGGCDSSTGGTAETFILISALLALLLAAKAVKRKMR